MSFFSNREQQLRDTGLLVMRLGLGAMFVYHGLPKIAGGLMAPRRRRTAC